MKWTIRAACGITILFMLIALIGFFLPILPKDAPATRDFASLGQFWVYLIVSAVDFFGFIFCFVLLVAGVTGNFEPEKFSLEGTTSVLTCIFLYGILLVLTHGSVFAGK